MIQAIFAAALLLPVFASANENFPVVPFKAAVAQGPAYVSITELMKTQVPMSEQARVLLILEGAEWLDGQLTSYESSLVPEPTMNGRTATQELNVMLSQVKAGDSKATQSLKALIRFARPQRDFFEVFRGRRHPGFMVLSPSHGITTNLFLRLLGQAIDENPTGLESFFENQIEDALKNPHCVACSESLASLLSLKSLRSQIPNFSRAREFLLLAAIHPGSEVRMMARLALSAFIEKDDQVRELLLSMNINKPENVYAKAEHDLVVRVLEAVEKSGQIGEIFQDWKSKILLASEGSRKNLKRSMAHNGVEIDSERMANIAAGHAFYAAALKPDLEMGRDLIVHWSTHTETYKESVAQADVAPMPRGTEVGNGTGFAVQRSFEFEGFSFVESLTEEGLAIEPRVDSHWSMMGLPRQSLIDMMNKVLETPPDLLYGHMNMIMAEIKHKFLDLRGPEFFYAEMEIFKKRVARHYRLDSADLERLSSEMLIKTVGKFPASLINIETALPKPTLDFLGNPVVAVKHESVFAEPLTKIFAIRALGLIGAKKMALEELRKLLPTQWDLNRKSQEHLAQTLSALDLDDEEGAFRADLTDEAKHNSLELLFATFRMFQTEAETRREIMRWLSGIDDKRLYDEGLRYFTVSCAEALK